MTILTRFDQRPTTFLVCTCNGPDNSVHSQKYRCCHGLFLQLSIIRSAFGHWPPNRSSLLNCSQPTTVSLVHNFVHAWSRVVCYSVASVIRRVLSLGHELFLPNSAQFNYHSTLDTMYCEIQTASWNKTLKLNITLYLSMYEGNSISKLQIVIEKNRMEIMTYKQHLFFNIISIQI